MMVPGAAVATLGPGALKEGLKPLLIHSRNRCEHSARILAYAPPTAQYAEDLRRVDERAACMVLAFSRWIREHGPLLKLKIKVTALPISISVNLELALHVIDFTGRVQLSELGELGRVHAQNLPWASADTFHIIADDADLSELTHAHLDAMRAHYRQLHQSIEFFMLRRSGWVCGSADACRIVEYWLHDRHSRDGQGTEVFLAAALDDLGELFSEDEIEAARTKAGFVEQLRIEHRHQIHT